MAKKEYREIVTKAVVGKGEMSFEEKHTIKLDNKPTTILGLWVINHKFSGKKENDTAVINGSFDVNIWYSCNDNTETKVASENITYNEKVDITMTGDDYDGDTDVLVRVVKGPICTNAEIDGESINYTIEKTIRCEVVGDAKIKIEVESLSNIDENNEKDKSKSENVTDEIKNEIHDDFLN